MFVPTGLDYRARWIRCVLLQRGLQLSVECSHERNQPRDSSDSGASAGPQQSAETLLRAHQALGHLGTILLGREQRHSKKIQKYGRQELRLSLNCHDTS